MITCFELCTVTKILVLESLVWGSKISLANTVRLLKNRSGLKPHFKLGLLSQTRKYNTTANQQKGEPR